MTSFDIDVTVVTKTEVLVPALDMMSCSADNQTSDKHKLSDRIPEIGNPYLHSCFQKYWQNHERIRAWLTAMERHFEKREVRRNWYWQMVTSQMYWAANYMHWRSGDALGAAASSSSVPRYNETLYRPVETQSDIPKSSTSRKRSRRASKKRRSSRHKHRCSVHPQITKASRHSLEGNDASECDADVFEFEMSEELLEFFKQTAEHRRERGTAIFYIS